MSGQLVQASAAVVEARYFGEDGNRAGHPDGDRLLKLWQADPIGTIAYMRSGELVAVFVYPQDVTDVALHEKATQGARAMLERWLESHALTPREYRPGLLSEGWRLAEDCLWRPLPWAGEGCTHSGILSRFFQYDPILELIPEAAE